MSDRKAYNQTYYLKTREEYSASRAASRKANKEKVRVAIEAAKSRSLR